MASKKTSAKTTDKKKAVSKKKTASVSKSTKAPVKKKSANKSKESLSFVPAAETEPFLTFKFTRQTVYWLIIAVASIAFAMWIYKLQADINYLYDQIELLQSIDEPLIDPTQVEASNQPESGIN